MDLLDASFSCDELVFNPLVSVHHGEQPVAPYTAPEDDASPSDFSLFFDAPLAPEEAITPEFESSQLIDWSPPTPSPPKPILPPATTSATTLSPKPVYASTVRNPSPLKQVFRLNDSVTSDDGSLIDMGMVVEEVVVADVVMVSTPKKEGKKWGIMQKMREEKQRVKSPVKDLVLVQDPADASVAFTFADYSLIADERGSFLYDGAQGIDNTLNSFAMSPIRQSNVSADVSDDMQNILAGLHTLSQPPTTSLPTAAPTAAVSLPTPSLLDVEDESSLLACSTASYRGYRDSPQKPARPQLDFLVEEPEHDQTPMRKGRSSNGSTASGTSGEDSPDMGSLWKNWRGDEMRTGDILGQGPPTAILRSEPTYTFEMGLIDPILPTPIVVVEPIAPAPIVTASPVEVVLLVQPEEVVVSTESNLMDHREPEVVRAPVESATERLRKKIDDLRQKKAVASASIACLPKSTSATFTSLPHISSSPIIRRQSHYVETNSVVFGASFNVSADLDTAITPAAPRRTLHRPTALAVPATTEAPVSIAHDSERKATTKERLEKAREERRRRESARSPAKRPATSSTLTDGSKIFEDPPVVVRKTVAPVASTTAPRAIVRTTSKLLPPSLSSASSSTTASTDALPVKSIAEALATSQRSTSSLASRYKFAPSVPRPASSSSRIIPPPSSRVLGPRTAPSSPVKKTIVSPVKARPIVSTSTSTGMQVPRSRLPALGKAVVAGERKMTGMVQPRALGTR